VIAWRDASLVSIGTSSCANVLLLSVCGTHLSMCCGLLLGFLFRSVKILAMLHSISKSSLNHASCGDVPSKSSIYMEQNPKISSQPKGTF